MWVDGRVFGVENGIGQEFSEGLKLVGFIVEDVSEYGIGFISQNKLQNILAPLWPSLQLLN